IPVTPRWAAATAGLMRLWAFYALRDHPAMLARKVLTMVGPAVEGKTPQGVPFGAMTGWSYQRLPWLIRRRQALPYAAALIRDWETRYFVAARLALAGPVSSIGTPNPSTLLRLADHVDPRVARRDLGFVASEGRLTVPLEDGTAAGVLAVHASFFEFIAEEEIDAPCPAARLPHELDEGRRYYVLLTGANGLYRYDLNDIVEVRGFHHRTPKVAFVRKGRDMVSITGEKLH